MTEDIIYMEKLIIFDKDGNPIVVATPSPEVVELVWNDGYSSKFFINWQSDYFMI